MLVVELAAHAVWALLGLEESLAILIFLHALLHWHHHLFCTMSKLALLSVPAESDFDPVLA